MLIHIPTLLRVLALGYEGDPEIDLFGASHAIERAVYRRAVEMYPPTAGQAQYDEPGTDEVLPDGELRHVLAGCLVASLATSMGFAYGEPPTDLASDRARLPARWQHGAEASSDYEDDVRLYPCAEDLLEFYLGMSTTSDTEPPSNEGDLNRDPSYVAEGVDFAIRLFCDPRHVAELVCDEIATMCARDVGRDLERTIAARCRRMARVIVAHPRKATT